MILEAFDNSMLSNYKRCPKYFFHRHVEHLSPYNQSFELDYKAQFGVAFHKAMDEWFLNGVPQKMDKAFLDIWIKFEGLDPKEIRTVKNGLDILQKYREKYPLDRDPFTVSPEHIEVGFACELGDYIYCGRIDKVVKWKFGFEGYVVLDHKTSASKGFLNIKPNASLDGYIWGASQLLSSPVIGAYLDQVYMYKTKTEFIRELTQRSAEEIHLWKMEVLDWIGKVRLSYQNEIWARNTSSCSAFGRDCEYKILCCSTDKVMISELKKSLYEVKEWLPYPPGSITETNHI